MVDFNGYKDLQEHFAHSLAIINVSFLEEFKFYLLHFLKALLLYVSPFQQVSEYERRNRHLQLTVDKLTQKLAFSSESEQKLLQQLHTFSKGSEDGLNILYIKLKGFYKLLFILCSTRILVK